MKDIADKIIQSVKSLPFSNEVIEKGGIIYHVGGFVRDLFLQKQSKDIDIVISNIEINDLEEILSKYGKIDSVGKSFGIIKFKSDKILGRILETDIALPRIERKISDGYTGFEVKSNHLISIETDLERRDFSVNSIAIDHNGNITDPFGGVEDIKKSVIRMTNKDTFEDDPLRMIRAVQFASRFNFKIEQNTLNSIKKNAEKIKQISFERVLIESDKIVKKGNKTIAAKLLHDSTLFNHIFDISNSNATIHDNIDSCSSVAEFIFLLLKTDFSNGSSIAEFFKTTLKGDIYGYKEIIALQLAETKTENELENRLLVFKMNKIFPRILNSKIISNNIKETIDKMTELNIPFSIKELQINGDDLITLGIQGVKIGEMLDFTIKSIYDNKIKNNKEEILKFITNKLDNEKTILT